MASSRNIIALNLGSQTIRVAEFQAQPEGELVLCNYCARESLIDPANERLDRDESASLREIVNELQIKGCEVNYAVAAQSVFTRFVRLPAIQEEKIERIISFEAQQNVPFPIDEVVWDYQLISGSADEEFHVLLVATKTDLVDDINRVVEETGLRTAIVDVATMTLYNAFRCNYSDLDGCSLLIDIGARTTNMLFIEPWKIFSRSIPLGGSSITAAIAKEFNEPFAVAESRKKRDGLVSLAGPYVDPDRPEALCVSKLTRITMARLQTEVMRSISHYRGQQQGNAPERVFLCGGAANTPHMDEFLREKLQVPVEFFNPLRNVRIAESAPADEVTRSAHLLGELIGLALRSAGGCEMELNLRPTLVVRRQELERRRPCFVIAALALFLALTAWGIYYTRAARVARSAAEKINATNAPMQVAETKIKNLRKQAASLDAVAGPLAVALNARFFWIEILEDLNARLPKADIWITELMPMSGGKPIGVDDKHAAETTQAPSSAVGVSTSIIKAHLRTIDGLRLHGLYLFNPRQQEIVVDYFRNLVDSPFFNIDPNDQKRGIKASIPSDTEWAFPYQLDLDLKKPVESQ